MDNENRIERVRQALTSGWVSSIEFYQDGSGASFDYFDPVGNHGRPCSMTASFPIDDAMKIVAGFRFTQHEIRRCF